MTAPKKPDPRQAAFEAWALARGVDIAYIDPADQVNGRIYDSPVVQLAWEAWKAASGRPTIDQTGIVHGRSFYNEALSDEQMIEATQPPASEGAGAPIVMKNRHGNPSVVRTPIDPIARDAFDFANREYWGKGSIPAMVETVAKVFRENARLLIRGYKRAVELGIDKPFNPGFEREWEKLAPEERDEFLSSARAALVACHAEEILVLLHLMRQEYGAHLSICGKTLVAVDNLLAKLDGKPSGGAV